MTVFYASFPREWESIAGLDPDLRRGTACAGVRPAPGCGRKMPACAGMTVALVIPAKAGIPLA